MIHEVGYFNAYNCMCCFHHLTACPYQVLLQKGIHGCKVYFIKHSAGWWSGQCWDQWIGYQLCVSEEIQYVLYIWGHTRIKLPQGRNSTLSSTQRLLWIRSKWHQKPVLPASPWGSPPKQGCKFFVLTLNVSAGVQNNEQFLIKENIVSCFFSFFFCCLSVTPAKAVKTRTKRLGAGNASSLYPRMLRNALFFEVDLCVRCTFCTSVFPVVL